VLKLSPLLVLRQIRLNEKFIVYGYIDFIENAIAKLVKDGKLNIWALSKAGCWKIIDKKQ